MSPFYNQFKTLQGQKLIFAAYDAALKRWPVPYETRTLQTGFGETHLIASGDQSAPALFLLHGGSANGTGWMPNIALLSQNFRTYALDIVGEMGKSRLAAPARGGMDFRAYGSWLAGAADQLEVQRFHVAGLSFGGWIALSTAVAHPERVAKVGLIAPAFGIIPTRPGFLARFMYARLFPSFKNARNFMKLTVAGGKLPYREDSIRHFQLLLRYGRPYRPRVNTFSNEQLHSLQPPVLLVIGEHEVIYAPQKVIQRARECIPHLQAEIIPGAGHVVSMEKPELVSQMLADFFLAPFP